MRFWDASAIVPLLHDESPSDALFTLLEQDEEMLVWWGTPVEIVSALARGERDGQLSTTQMAAAEMNLQHFGNSWQEVQPSELVRRTAQRLLRVHSLRAADSLQLAAAVIAADHQPSSLEFVSLDARLNNAARREGFIVIDLSAEPRNPGPAYP